MRIKPSYPRLRRDHPLIARLAGAWSFADVQGDQIVEHVYHNHSTITGATWVPGRFGSAVNFVTGNYAESANFRRYAMLDGGLVTARIRPKGTVFAGRIVDFGTTGTNAATGWSMFTTGADTIGFRVNAAASASSVDNVVPENEWAIVSAQVVTNSTKRIWVNGRDVTSNTGGNIAMPSPSGPLRIGNRASGTDRTFVGEIDFVSILDGQIDEDTIRQIHADPFDLFRPRSRSYLFLDAGSGEPSVTPEPIQLALELSSPAATVAYTAAPEPIQSLTQLSSPEISVAYASSPGAIQLGVELSSPMVTVSGSANPEPIQLALQLSSPEVSTKYTADPEPISLAVELSSPSVSFIVPGEITPQPIQMAVELSSPAVTFHVTAEPESIQLSLELSSPLAVFRIDIVPESLQIALELSSPAVSFSTPPVVGGRNIILTF